MGHLPRIPVWLRWDQSVVYFVTLCVENRKPVLANGNAFVVSKRNCETAGLDGPRGDPDA